MGITRFAASVLDLGSAESCVVFYICGIEVSVSPELPQCIFTKTEPFFKRLLRGGLRVRLHEGERQNGDFDQNGPQNGDR